MSALLLREEKTRDLTRWRLENARVALTVSPELWGQDLRSRLQTSGSEYYCGTTATYLSRVWSSVPPLMMFSWGAGTSCFRMTRKPRSRATSFPTTAKSGRFRGGCRPRRRGDEIGLLLEVTGPVTGVHLQKRITLSSADPDRIYFRHRLEHRGTRAFPFLWKLHPAFRISHHHRIHLPANRMKLDREYSTTPDTDREEFEWPICPDRKGRPVDMRKIPPRNAGSTLFAYGTGLKEGWFALTDLEHDLGFAYRFPQAIFPTCWLFASFGGWSSHYCLLIEPCSGYPYRLAEAMRMGTCPLLQPGQVLEFGSVGTFFRGRTEVCGVTGAGQVS